MSTRTLKSPSQEAGEATIDAFRNKLGPFVVAAEKTRMPMLFLDATDDYSILFANDAFLNLTGYSRDEVIATDVRSLLAEGFDDENLQKLETAFLCEVCGDTEVYYIRKDGTEFWASMLVSPVTDKSGRVVQYFASFADLTAHRLENRRCNMLIDELDHRVKNTLATVQVMATYALRDPVLPATIRVAIESRIQALSQSHDLLTKTKWDGSGLYDLVEMAMKPFDTMPDRRNRITIAGNNMLLSPKTTLAIAIALNELATNSIKYGAFANDEGHVAVNWNVERNPAGDRLHIHWQERNGPVVPEPTHQGFGSWVLRRGIAHELDGSVTLDYLPEGVRCLIDIPAPVSHRSIQ